MGFTPAFQKVLDECELLAEKTKDPKEVQAYFFAACVQLGPLERLCNLYRIRPKDPVPGETSRLSFFFPNSMQLKFFKEHSNRDMVLKMRQGGVTTFSCLIALDMSLFGHGVNTAIMAHVQPRVKDIFKMVKTAFKAFQRDWASYYPLTSPQVDNVSQLQIAETGSSLTVCTEAKGLTLDFLHISEAAFVEDSRISESIEAVPFNGWVILETTADAASGYFWELWDRWEKGKDCAFKGHFFEWWYQYPETSSLPFLTVDDKFKYTDEEAVLVQKHKAILTPQHIVWRRIKIAEVFGDVGEFLRKYPEDSSTCFLSGASCFFAAGTMHALWKNEKDPAFVGRLMQEAA